MNRLPLLLILLVYHLPSLAQPAPSFIPRYNYNNHNVWISTVGVAKLTSKIDLYSDLQIRQSNYGKSPMQYLIRPGLLYNVNNQFALGGGYTYAITCKYGDIPQNRFTFPEHRLWEQFVLKTKVNRVEFSQRIRMEQRWIGEVSQNMEVDKYRYQNRFRILSRVNIPINGTNMEQGIFYFAAYEELLINFGKNVGGNIYDQNRLYIGLGYNAGSTGRIEIGYLYQNLMQRRIWYPSGNTQVSSGYNVFENNHTLLLTYSFKIDFAKKVD